MRVYFVTHATTHDNERGIASGRGDVGLSPVGRSQAAALPDALRYLRFDVVVCSPLRRARETAELAFGDRYPVRVDGRLSEVDYGIYAGRLAQRIEQLQGSHITVAFPGGESYEQRLALLGEFLEEFARGEPGKTPLLIGHRATLYCLRRLAERRTFQEIMAERYQWQPYWEFELGIGSGE